jgi:hypothetical protein
VSLDEEYEEEADDIDLMEDQTQEHMVVEKFLESLCKKQLHVKEKQEAVGTKDTPCGDVRALRYTEFQVEKYEKIAHIWEATVARRKSLEDGASGSVKGRAATADVIVISDDTEDM